MTLKSAMPEILAVKSPVTEMVRSASPSLSPCFSAVAPSTTTSVGPRGSWPEAISTERSSFGVQLTAIVGAPLAGPTFSFLASTTVTLREVTAPCTFRAPSAFATFSRSAAGKVSGRPVCGTSSSDAAPSG